MSKEFRTPPASLYFIRDEVTAWMFNRAVWAFGTQLDAALAGAEVGARNAGQVKRKRQSIMNKWMTMPGEEVRGRFADPAAKMKKAAAAPADRPERPEFMRG